MQQFRPTVAEINLDHISHNVELIHSLIKKDRFFCPMVKANAYGHGSVEVSRLLEDKGIKRLGVCILEEAFELLSSGLKSKIFVFQSVDRAGLHALLENQMNISFRLHQKDQSSTPSSMDAWANQIVPIVSSLDQLEWTREVIKKFWNQHQLRSPFEIQLKFDTGMNRFGLPLESSDEVIRILREEPGLKLTGIASHLLQGEDLGENGGRTSDQLMKMRLIQNKFSDFNIEYHLFNSPAIGRILNGSFSDDLKIGLRPGLMLYGYSSLSNDKKEFKPAMTLKSKVSHFRKLNSGETVSYGGTWRAEKASIIAVVPLGYADGVRRGLSNKSKVLVNGYLAPIVGSVCMDSFMVDVSEIKDQIPLDNPHEVEVVLWGYSQQKNFLSAGEKANDLQTHIWEILTSPSSRVPRVYVGGRI